MHRPVAQLSALAGTILVLGAPAAAAAARPAAPQVDVQPLGRLSPDGQSIAVDVIAKCAERSTVIEATVTVSQPQASGRASFPLTCVGSLRVFSVTVPAAAGTFELAPAQASASVVVKGGQTQRAQDTETLHVQPNVLVELADSARLESGGGAVTLAVAVACPVGANGLGATLNVSQGQASGNGTYMPICDGLRHVFDVRVQASRGVYQAGSAQALTFADVEHTGGMVVTGVDDGEVQLLP
jgi:hypothetical protein